MAVRRLETGILVHAPREAAFGWVADYRNARRSLEDVREWEPLDPRRTTGPGARFRVRVALLGITAGGVLELDSWEEPEEIGWHAGGARLEVRGRWTFVAHPSGTRVGLALEYEPPGGPLGGFGMDRLAGLAKRRLQAGLETLRDAVEPY